MIDTDEFRKQLVAEHVYRTPERVKRNLWYRMFGWADFVYNCAVFGIVYRGSRLARSGGWNPDTWLNLSLGMIRAIENCGGRVEVEGLEHLAALKGPAVIVANHMSLLETFALPSIILPFINLTFVVKVDLTLLPLFKDVMMGSKPIAVGRQNPKDDFKTLMEEGPKVLAGGRSILVFPESTRHGTFRPAEFNTVGLKLAKRAGVPLLPLALKSDFQGLGKLFRDFGPVDRKKTVHFKFGAPMDVSGNGREEHASCVQYIRENIEGWGGIIAES